MKKLICITLCLACLSLTAGRKRERIETPQAGAVLQLGFNDGPAIRDWSGYGNHGTNNGAVWGFTNGIAGAGYAFNGVNAYIGLNLSINNDLQPESYSIGMWIFPYDDFNDLGSGVAHEQQFASQSRPTDNQSTWLFKIDTDSDRLQFACFDEAGALVANSYGTSTNWNANQRYHIFVTFNRAGYEFYLDGVSDGYTADADSFGAGSASSCFLGRTAAATVPQYFHGLLDEVYFCARTLSADEIKALYEQGKANRNP